MKQFLIDEHKDKKLQKILRLIDEYIFSDTAEEKEKIQQKIFKLNGAKR